MLEVWRICLAGGNHKIMKYEKFTGIPSLETYNLFSCQEYQESEVAVVSTQLDEDDKSFVFQRLRESRSLSANQYHWARSYIEHSYD